MAQTLFVRDGDNYREASAQDILEHLVSSPSVFGQARR